MDIDQLLENNINHTADEIESIDLDFLDKLIPPFSNENVGDSRNFRLQENNSNSMDDSAHFNSQTSIISGLETPRATPSTGPTENQKLNFATNPHNQTIQQPTINLHQKSHISDHNSTQETLRTLSSTANIKQAQTNSRYFVNPDIQNTNKDNNYQSNGDSSTLYYDSDDEHGEEGNTRSLLRQLEADVEEDRKLNIQEEAVMSKMQLNIDNDNSRHFSRQSSNSIKKSLKRGPSTPTGIVQKHQNNNRNFNFDQPYSHHSQVSSNSILDIDTLPRYSNSSQFSVTEAGRKILDEIQSNQQESSSKINGNINANVNNNSSQQESQYSTSNIRCVVPYKGSFLEQQQKQLKEQIHSQSNAEYQRKQAYYNYRKRSNNSNSFNYQNPGLPSRLVNEIDEGNSNDHLVVGDNIIGQTKSHNLKDSKNNFRINTDNVNYIDTVLLPTDKPEKLSDSEISKHLASFNMRKSKMLMHIENTKRDLQQLEVLKRQKRNELKHDLQSLDMLSQKINQFRLVETQRMDCRVEELDDNYQETTEDEDNEINDVMEIQPVTGTEKEKLMKNSEDASTIDSGIETPKTKRDQTKIDVKKNPPGLQYYSELD